MLKVSTGDLGSGFSTGLRLSQLESDGYRDRSWAEMWNYYGSIVRYGEKTTLQINLFGGPEETHLAYEGIPKAYLDGEISGDERHDRRQHEAQEGALERHGPRSPSTR